MIDYITFWLAKALVEIGIAVAIFAFVGALVGILVWIDKPRKSR